MSEKDDINHNNGNYSGDDDGADDDGDADADSDADEGVDGVADGHGCGGLLLVVVDIDAKCWRCRRGVELTGTRRRNERRTEKSSPGLRREN